MNKKILKSNQSFENEELILEFKKDNLEIKLENTKVLIVNSITKDVTFIINKNVEILFLNFNNDLKQKINFTLINNDSNLKVGEITFAKEENNFSKNANIIHKSNDSISNYAFIGFAKDDSKLSMKIVSKVNKTVVGTKVKQKITCFTSGNAKVITDPILEIKEFDSEAYHGNSIGKIDESEITALMTKGFSKEESKKIIINGKIEKVLSILSKDLSLKAKELIKENYDW